jgi:hypothetical protein
MALTEQQCKDIEEEDKVEGPGWIFVVSASSISDREPKARRADLHTLVGVSSRRLDGIERPFEEGKIIALEKAQQKYRRSFPDDPLPTLTVLTEKSCRKKNMLPH